MYNKYRDLHENQIIALPEEIGNLVNLTSL